MLFHDFDVIGSVIPYIKGKNAYLCYKLSYSAFSIFSNVREVNLVYPIHNGSCHKQQMINNDKLNHGKPTHPSDSLV
jgi:hypothetical protein